MGTSSLFSHGVDFARPCSCSPWVFGSIVCRIVSHRHDVPHRSAIVYLEPSARRLRLEPWCAGQPCQESSSRKVLRPIPGHGRWMVVSNDFRFLLLLLESVVRYKPWCEHIYWYLWPEHADVSRPVLGIRRHYVSTLYMVCAGRI